MPLSFDRSDKFAWAKDGNRRLLSEMWYDATVPENQSCVVKHRMTHVEGYGATFEEAIADFRDRQSRFFSEIHTPEHGGTVLFCEECLHIVGARNAAAFMKHNFGGVHAKP